MLFFQLTKVINFPQKKIVFKKKGLNVRLCLNFALYLSNTN